jgi:hypothetical protein
MPLQFLDVNSVLARNGKKRLAGLDRMPTGRGSRFGAGGIKRIEGCEPPFCGFIHVVNGLGRKNVERELIQPVEKVVDLSTHGSHRPCLLRVFHLKLGKCVSHGRTRSASRGSE